MRQNIFARLFIYIALFGGVLLFIMPFVWMVLTSLKTSGQVFGTNTWLPSPVTFQSYIKIFQENAELGVLGHSVRMPFFILWFFNSCGVAAGIIVFGLFFDSLAGFTFAKYQFPGRNIIFWLILITLMIPPQVTMIPSFMVLSKLKLVGTLTGLIIGGVVNAFGIFLVRQYMKTIPNELIDAARIDGASPFQIYYRIALPLAAPVLGALAIFKFVGTWNNFLWPLVVLGGVKEKFTLPLGLASYQGQFGTTTWDLEMAGSVLATLPIIIFFLLMQRHFISGITLGSVKE